ncbi:hypothetical protein [Caenispirillum bisanense]|uniref:hypothetical protein n=1 Tax=Caenispirillum bisanense TaxID=414052 RepID=UPI0031E2C9DE
MTDSAKVDARIAVTFTDHCFTRDRRQGDAADLAFPGCSRDDGVFCLQRYHHSLQAPAYIRDFHRAVAWNLKGDETYAVIPTVTQDGQAQHYAIIFSLDRVRGVEGIDLHMRVRTAHPRTERDLTTYGSIRFAHLVRLRRENQRPRRVYDSRRRKPRRP